MSAHWILSPPNSGVVLGMRYFPNPVAITGAHLFYVQNVKSATFHQDVTSSVVKVRASGRAGLRLIAIHGGYVYRVVHGRLHPTLKPGAQTPHRNTILSKHPGTTSTSADVETRISFQLVPLPGRPLPRGTGATIHRCSIAVSIA